ncbi:hypothetical protein D3C86_1791670 [compost metagenome]
MRLHGLFIGGQAALARRLEQQLLVDQLIQRGLAQAFVGTGVADTGRGAALGLQVVGKIAFQAKFGDRYAVDPRRHGLFLRLPARQHQ